jgi:hypothetical protein
MPRSTNLSVATMGIDIGKNSFHVVGLDQRGAIVVRQRWTRSQIRARLANMPPCLIGMEALRRSPSPQLQAAFAWPRCAAHASEVRQTVSQRAKERFPRC